jgi:asparagine synthase (glutamine-hydrolysing)
LRAQPVVGKQKERNALCGIAGYTRIYNGFSSQASISRTLDDLVHRGPDEQGIFESKHVALGAVRLRIIDLAGGHQPAISEDGDVVVVFNGEIYNHNELRQQLSALGHRFRTRCDTEVILHAFLEWGLDCFARLRGMFAIAVWTESQRRLVLARDRLGIKPLYFCRRGPDICFGSELKAILVHPEVERRLDLDALNCYLGLNYVPGPHTLLKGIEKLPPGHWLDWQDGLLTINSYWRLEHSQNGRWTEESAAQRLDELLRQSMREHLVADVPLGVWISGGLDSSTILHYAAEASPSRLMTFSVSFEGRGCDESKYFREVARHYGTEHMELDLSPELDLADAIEQLPYYHDEPGADAGALPVWFLAQLSRRKVTVVLSGEGADELFGGYLTYMADRLVRPLRLVPAAMRRAALRLLRYWPVSDEKISLEYKLKRFLEGSLLPPRAAHLYWYGAFSEAQKRRVMPAAGDAPLRRLLQEFENERAPARGLNGHLLFDQLYYLPDDILSKVDRMSMAHSLEARPPFLDHRIVEFAASLPANLKVRGLVQKYLLRRLMKGRLPVSVLKRSKEGFDIPAHEWFRGPLRPLLLDTLNAEAVKETQLFRWEGIRALIDDHLARRANLGYQLWGLLILFLWLRRWKVQTRDLVPESCAEPREEAALAGSWAVDLFAGLP